VTATREAELCACRHERSYHKSGIGPCWYPVKLAQPGSKPETCNCREYREK
jgi:hypothetical protein